MTAFLEDSEFNAHLHPDAVLTGGGVQFSAVGGPLGGVIIHGLRRIEAGLQGEVLAPEADDFLDTAGYDLGLDGLEGGDAQTFVGTGRFGRTAGQNGDTPKKSALKRRAVENWDLSVNEGAQDPETYARSQTILEGDVGDRDFANGEDYDMDEEPEVVDHEDLDQMGGSGGIIDKDARKVDKKARKKAAQREKEMARAGG